MGFIFKSLFFMKMFQGGLPEMSAEQFIGLLYLIIPAAFGIIIGMYFYTKPRKMPPWIGVRNWKPKEDDIEIC